MYIHQFVHTSRPSLYYGEMPIVTRHLLDELPRDNRYLEAILSVWREGGMDKGVIVLEQDVAIDPRHIEELHVGCVKDAAAVWAVPYIVWPISTGRGQPTWAHTLLLAGERRHAVPADQPCPRSPHLFGLGCTYLPPNLLGSVPDTDRPWDYPLLDDRLSEAARRLGISVHTTATPAIHLHW